LKQITDTNFASQIAGEELSLVMFTAPWAGPCNLVRPNFEAAAARFGNQITFGEFIIDDNPNIPEKYGLRGVPTFYLLKRGNPVVVKTGAITEEAIIEICEGALEDV